MRSTRRPANASAGGQVDGRGGLSDSPFLVGDGDDSGHNINYVIELWSELRPKAAY